MEELKIMVAVRDLPALRVDRRFRNDWRYEEVDEGTMFVCSDDRHGTSLSSLLEYRSKNVLLSEAVAAWGSDALVQLDADALKPSELLAAMTYRTAAGIVLDKLHAEGRFTLGDVRRVLEAP